MKGPAGKIHFMDVADPVPSGKDYVAKCGFNVVKAEFKLYWDVKMLGKPQFRTLNTCQVCWASHFSQRYLYGMIQGSEQEGFCG